MTSSLQQRPSSRHNFPFVCSRIGHHERWFRTLSQKESTSTLDLGLIIRSFSLRVLAITTATPKAWKTSFENEHLGSCDHFAVMPPSLNFLMSVKYATTAPQGAPLVQTQRIKELLFYAYVVVKTAIVVISRCCFAEDGTKLCSSACRTCSTLIFYHSTNQILNLWRRYSLCCRGCYSFLITTSMVTKTSRIYTFNYEKQ